MSPLKSPSDRNKQGKGAVKCPKCYYWPLDLEKHLTEKHLGEETKCYVCDKDLLSASSLKSHNEICHSQKLFKCELCNYETLTRPTYNVHMKGVHHGSERINCDECDKTFTLRGNFRAHKKSIHQKIKYKCDFCNYETVTNGALRNHTASLHFNKVFRCTSCDYEATFNSNLHRHIKSKHKGVRYKCTNCEKSYSCSSHLQRHRKEVHEKKDSKVREKDIRNLGAIHQCKLCLDSGSVHQDC